VIALATVIRSAFGFWEALVAVPLLALFIPVEVSVSLCLCQPPASVARSQR
jgi:hypothetical protein